MTLIKIYFHGNQGEQIPIAALDMHPEMIQKLEETGIIETSGNFIEYKYVKRISKFQRLRNFFGVNISGAAIILDLMDRIEALEKEIEELKK